jgi:hypothetical protein
VVCGFLDVIEIFWPIIWFKSVDFPAFGAPTMATNPDLKIFNLSCMFDMLYLSKRKLGPLGQDSLL